MREMLSRPLFVSRAGPTTRCMSLWSVFPRRHSTGRMCGQLSQARPITSVETKAEGGHRLPTAGV